MSVHSICPEGFSLTSGTVSWDVGGGEFRRTLVNPRAYARGCLSYQLLYFSARSKPKSPFLFPIIFLAAKKSMTISVLRRLHEIIGHAIDDIERVYAAHADDPRSAPTSKRSSPIPTATQTQSPTPPESECGDAPSATSPAATAPQAHTFKGRQTHLSSPSNSGAYASPPPSPSVANIPGAHTVSPISSKESPKESCREPQLLSVDFPSLDAPYDGGSLSEILTTHPTVLEAIGNIVAAAGQLSAMAQTPFLTLCEAIMAVSVAPRRTGS